jgi:hypothetical protein
MTMEKRTRVQVEPPHIIQELPVDLTTEDEEQKSLKPTMVTAWP